MDFKKLKITTPQKLLEYFNKNFMYGFTYRGKVFVENSLTFNNDFNKFYKIRLKEDFVKNKYGVCWDYCEFEREFFSSVGIKHTCYFVLNFLTREDGGPTHTFLLYEQNNKWFWFEWAWQQFRGIWEYNTKEEALADVLTKFVELNAVQYDHTDGYEFNKVSKRLNAYLFVEHCMQGKPLNINDILNKK